MSRILALVVVLAVGFFAAPAFAAEARRPGTIQFSDGTAWQGGIALARGARLDLHDGHAMRHLDLAQVAELVFTPRAESLERAFTMPEPGKPIRVETGEPYPLRQFAVRARLGDGSTVTGHLYATALTVLVPPAIPAADPDAQDGEVRKLPLPAKQRGQPGQSLEQLVYVQRIRFSAVATAAVRHLSVRTPAPVDDLAAATVDGLMPLAIEAGQVQDPLDSPVIWAVRQGGRAAVGWDGSDPALCRRLQDVVVESNDFFDRREVLAAHAVGEDVLAVMRLTRVKPTVEKGVQPWHLEIWRWRLDGDRALIAGRVRLLRGTDGKPPAVDLRPAWAALAPVDGVYTLGGWP